MTGLIKSALIHSLLCHVFRVSVCDLATADRRWQTVGWWKMYHVVLPTIIQRTIKSQTGVQSLFFMILQLIINPVLTQFCMSRASYRLKASKIMSFCNRHLVCMYFDGQWQIFHTYILTRVTYTRYAILFSSKLSYINDHNIVAMNLLLHICT